MNARFRGFLPVIVDVETGGFNPQTDALLEIAAVLVSMDDNGRLQRGATHAFEIEPFAGANIEASALEFTGIDLESDSRNAVAEDQGLGHLFKAVRQAVVAEQCSRAVVVGHNAHFDLRFVHTAAERCQIKRNPFHPFTCFDTATLAGLAFGQTVLAKACKCANISFSNSQAHSAAYDAEKTADLFCHIINQWQELGGWTPESLSL